MAAGGSAADRLAASSAAAKYTAWCMLSGQEFVNQARARP
jgi:hypothetical protein